jgi:hypothetical protein
VVVSLRWRWAANFGNIWTPILEASGQAEVKQTLKCGSYLKMLLFVMNDSILMGFGVIHSILFFMD